MSIKKGEGKEGGCRRCPEKNLEGKWKIK